MAAGGGPAAIVRCLLSLVRIGQLGDGARARCGALCRWRLEPVHELGWCPDELLPQYGGERRALHAPQRLVIGLILALYGCTGFVEGWPTSQTCLVRPAAGTGSGRVAWRAGCYAVHCLGVQRVLHPCLHILQTHDRGLDGGVEVGLCALKSCRCGPCWS